MISFLNEIFKDVELLLKTKVPFTRDSDEYKTVLSISSSPRLVPTYQFIVNEVADLHLLQDVSWSIWLSSFCLRLVEAVENLEDVISVSHLALLRASITKLISFSVLPNLPCQLPYPSTYTSLPLSLQQRQVIIELVMRVVIVMFKNDHTRSSVVKHYGETLAALISLNTITVGNTQLQSNKRKYYKETITMLLDTIHQPTVFTHLMILLTAKGDGGKVSRIVRKVLESKLEMAGGVLALMGATILSDEHPPSTQDITRISNLLVASHPQTFYQHVFPQVLSLLREEDARCHQVAATCISVIQDKDSALCESYFLSPLLSPLETACCENEINPVLVLVKRWVDAAPPGVNLSRPLPLISFLYSSIYHENIPFKSKVSELLVTCLNRLAFPCSYLISIIFPPHPGVKYLKSESTVKSIKNNEPIAYENTAQVILHFLNNNKLNNIKIELFRNLLRYIVDGKIPLEHKLVSTQVLSQLSSDSVVLESLSKEPKYLIDFLIDLFSENFDSESISMGLILLNIFLNDDKFISNKVNLSMVRKLEEPLMKLTLSSDYEIGKLSNEMLSKMSGMGVIKSIIGGKAVEGEFEAAYRESIDPHLPVRAHALRTFAKLLRDKDKTTMRNKTTLLHIFKSNLEDGDSYLYLSAVEGFSSLVSVFPDEMVPSLCHEFSQGSPHYRLKIGQVIIKTTNLLGEKTGEYSKELLETLVRGAEDSDPLVRTSSLSNIGEIAKLLSYKIHSHLKEIFELVERTVDTDQEEEPRRAAVMLVSLLLQGLGKHTFIVLEKVILDLYRKLRVIYETDSDEVTRLHAQIALEHLSHSTRALFFPDTLQAIDKSE